MPITIGIPFYNAEKYFADAIRSVFAQTYQEWDLILIDDGSTDRSLEIARAVNDPRVRVISDGLNKRLPYRLNQIAREAKYDVVGRMDADDLISPTRFEMELEVLNRHPEVDLVTTGICSITNDNRPIGTRCGSPGESITGRNLLFGTNGIVHAAIVARRAWFLRNPYDPSAIRMEDYELWLRAYSKNDFRIHVLGEPLYYYREEENVTAKRILTAYAGQRELYKKYGPLWLRRHEVSLVVAKSHCKSLAVRIFSALNRMDILLKRRNKEIEDKESMNFFVDEIDRVLKTKVPGLD